MHHLQGELVFLNTDTQFCSFDNSADSLLGLNAFTGHSTTSLVKIGE